MTGSATRKDYAQELPKNGIGRQQIVDAENLGQFDDPPPTIIVPRQHPFNGQQQRKPQQTVGQVLKSKFFLAVVVVCVILITCLCIGLVTTYEADNDITATVDAWNDKLSAEQLFWFQSGLTELKHALGVAQNTRRAKNVILFVADGMGPSTVTAARIYKEREEGHLIWERFPHMGMLKVSAGD